MDWSRVADNRKFEHDRSPSAECRQAGRDRHDDAPSIQEERIAYWQIKNPPVAIGSNKCLQCRDVLDGEGPNWLHVIIGPHRIAGIHATCHRTWSLRRRSEAIRALALVRLGTVRDTLLNH